MLGVQVENVQQQFGSNDCGIFAVAFTLHLTLGDDLQHILFEQSKMQPSEVLSEEEDGAIPTQIAHFNSN